MRERFFRKTLQILEKHTPEIIIRAELQILLNTTARGFGVPKKRIWMYPAAKALKEYAKFTAACLHTEECDTETIGDGSACLHAGKRDSESTDAVSARQCGEKSGAGTAGTSTGSLRAGKIVSRNLFRAAYLTGRQVRRLTGFTAGEDISRLTFWLYRNLCITMTGQIPGKIMVKNCYFSKYYSPEDCRIMSYVDSGIISGLCGGGRLTFTKRITEGCKMCTAYFNGKQRSGLPGTLNR
ncbi:MAG: hypothetical protein J6D53_00035 [Blautia sp.]|nr:hypothetical protein [Blautia sp.]